MLRGRSPLDSCNFPLIDVPWRRAVISVDQFSPDDISEIFAQADRLAFGRVTPLGGKMIANLFYEPSTRTSSSFYAAMTRLGGSVIPINEVNYSSVTKGESLEDTIRTVECYSDLIDDGCLQFLDSVGENLTHPEPILSQIIYPKLFPK